MEKLIYVLNKIGQLYDTNHKQKFNLENFNQRIKYQKLIFLISEKMKNMDYYYNWYKKGPYCPTLTKDLYAIDELFNKSPKIVDFIIDKNKEIFAKLDNEIDKICDLEEQFKSKFGKKWDSLDLEILASIIFIDKYTYKSCNNQSNEKQVAKKNCINELVERKPKMKENKNLTEYWDLLERNNFI